VSMPETIQPAHLARLAVVYVRQSSPHQVLTNRESLKLQYALRDKAIAAGWPAEQVRVIDTDLGRSGRFAQPRHGFQELVALVNQERVGILFAYDASRLARNCTDWYTLLDLCGFRGCLVGDQDGIYDPATPNGRLLLGLKGLISELELHTLRARLQAGLLSKAQRGELALPLPAGLIRDSLGRVLKHPSQEVQARLELVFSTFLRVKTASQALRVFTDEELLLPRLDRFGDLVWRKATDGAIRAILTNPAYAGCYVYGQSRTVPKDAASMQRVRKRLPIEEWKIRIPDRYPAYITWATFETIQGMLHDNHAEYDRDQTRGIPRAGQALLAGLVYCGECGHKLSVRYKEGPRYLCTALHDYCQAPRCQNLPASAIDAYALRCFFDALSPVELDLYEKAVAGLQKDDEQLRQAQQQQLERLSYQARLAERQYNQADPDNRLVTAELERRWEAALRELKEAEEKFQQQPMLLEALSDEEREAFVQAGQKVPELWRQGLLSAQQQKALLRCLIDKVVARRSAADTVQVRVVWRGGATTEASLRVPVNSLARLSDIGNLEKEIVRLSKAGKKDKEIAAQLSGEGYRSPRQDVLLGSTVRNIRLRHGLLRKRRHTHHVQRYLTVTQLADRLGVSRFWVYNRIHRGTIEVSRDSHSKLYLFPNTTKTITLFKQLRAGKLDTLRF
jgi:DNA invertase Pin-like site-specific DNA recombinase